MVASLRFNGLFLQFVEGGDDESVPILLEDNCTESVLFHYFFHFGADWVKLIILLEFDGDALREWQCFPPFLLVVPFCKLSHGQLGG